MKKILLFIAPAAIIWFACCKDDVPDDGFSSPVFMVDFESDSIMMNTSLTAGVGGVYLFTRGEQDPDDVLVMSGTFADANCPAGDCPGSVRFEFRNLTTGSITDPSVIFQDGVNWNYNPHFSDSLELNTVAIRWVMPDGKVFRSDISPQPQPPDTAFFRILGSERWELNERGEPTWKMGVDFSCTLFDSIQGQQRKIMGSGVIAVAY